MPSPTRVARSVAANHTLDFNDRGLLDTLHHLDAAGIRHAGAGRNLHEAANPVLLDISGLEVGFISLTDNEPAFAAASDRLGTRYLPIRSDRATLLLIETAVGIEPRALHFPARWAEKAYPVYL